MEMIIVFIFYAFGQVASFDFQDLDDNYVLGIPYVTFSSQLIRNDGNGCAHDTRNNCSLHKQDIDPAYLVNSLSKILTSANMKNPISKEVLQNYLNRPYRKADSDNSISSSVQKTMIEIPESEYSPEIPSKPIVKREIISRNRFFYNKDVFSKFFDSFISLLTSLNPELLNSLKDHLDSKFNTEPNSILIERKMGTLLALKPESCSCAYRDISKPGSREYSTTSFIGLQNNKEKSSNCRCKTTDSAFLKQNPLAEKGTTSVSGNLQTQKLTTGDVNVNVSSELEKDSFKSELFKPWHTFRPFFGLGRIQGDVGSHFHKGFLSTETASTISTELLAASETEVNNLNVLVAEDKLHLECTEPVMSTSTFSSVLYKLSKDLLQRILPNLGSENCLDALKSAKDSNKLVDQLLDKLFSKAIESAAASSTTVKDEFGDYQLELKMPSDKKLFFGPESYFKPIPTLIQRPLKGNKKLHNKGGSGLSGFILEAAKNHSDSSHIEQEEGSVATTSQYEEDDGLLRNDYDQNYFLECDQREEEKKAQIPLTKDNVGANVLILNPFNDNKSLDDLKRLEESKKADLNEKLKMNSNLLHQSIEQIPLHIAFMKNIHYSSRRPKRNKNVLAFKQQRKVDKLNFK